MMGRQVNPQEKLFSYHVNLSERVRKDHPLRKVAELIDFDFLYNEVKDTYGKNGNVSVAPPVILKMMFLLYYYDVRSEREFMDTIPERVDWLWFLGYGLDDKMPDHSVLSKARERWGVRAFRKFFNHILIQCVRAGLVDGSKVFIDSSLIDADASNNSVVHTSNLKRYLNKSYQKLEESLDLKETLSNSKYISTTDPDAEVTRHSKSKAKPRYKTHRAVDIKHEVITATKVTGGSVDDGDMFTDMVETHEHNTKKDVDTTVCDTKYGTIDNYLYCHDRGIKAHIPSLGDTHKGKGRQEGIFPNEDFIYNAETDTFTCPAGQILKMHHYHKNRKHYEYRASKKVCAKCPLRQQCTRAKDGRSLKRHERQDDLDLMRDIACSKQSKRDIRTRQHLSERSFALSTRYGYKRSRWRRLWRVKIQDFLIAAIQNISILIRQLVRKKANSNVLPTRKGHYSSINSYFSCLEQFFRRLLGQYLPKPFTV